MEFCGMEARALKKSSFRRELSMKQTQQDFLDDNDFQGYNPANGVVSVEDFSVDCFLDFGEFKENYIHEKVTTEEEEEEDDDDEEEEEKDSLSVSSQERTDDDSNSNSTCFSDSFLPTELFVPVEDLAELEWVSKFVDDSLSDLPQFYPPCFNEEKPQIPSRNLLEPQQPKPALTKTVLLLPSVFPFHVPAKPRTKRTRPSTGPTWSVRSSITEPSSSSSTTSSYSSPPHLIFTNTVPPLQGLGEPSTKKPKKKSTVQTGVGLIQFQRRCSHCQVHKTPQWRTGPLGPKTLCNACGVRFKSGRLLPEYRPACSPTFSSDIHSNSHRKVIEMRKKRELVGLTGFETKPNDLKVLNG